MKIFNVNFSQIKVFAIESLLFLPISEKEVATCVKLHLVTTMLFNFNRISINKQKGLFCCLVLRFDSRT